MPPLKKRQQTNTNGYFWGILELNAKGQSKIEKTLQVPEVKELVTSLSNITERAGFEPAVEAYTPTTV